MTQRAISATDLAGLLHVPDGQPTSLSVAASDPHVRVRGLTPSQLERRGGGTVEQLRGLVRQVHADGGQVHLAVTLADAATTARELTDALTEIVDLALRCPGAIVVHDDSEGPYDDPWVAAAMAAGVLDPDRHYTASLASLRELWRPAMADATDDATVRTYEALLRELDDGPRRAVFRMLAQAWRADTEGWPGERWDKDLSMATAVELLGEHERWLRRFRQFTYDTVRRMVVIPTWQCELRCSYCFIPKQDGRVMSLPVMERSIDMLLGTEQDEVMLQFFGGEALLEYERVKHGITYATERAEQLGKTIPFVLSSNGWSLDAEKVQWLAQYPVKLELSLDGDERTQNRYRPSRHRHERSYDHSIATHAKAILDSGIEQYVIMVVHPTNVDAMPANFFHLADMGFRHIQINNMLGRMWKPHELTSWANGLFEIGRELISRWDRGEEMEFINLRHQPMAMRLNGEVTVDHDGTIYGGNGFLHETEHKDKFVVGDLDGFTNIDRYWIDATDNAFLLDWSYRPKITANNVEVGKVLASFNKWMKQRGYGPTGPLTERES